jgi:hypothetical protein
MAFIAEDTQIFGLLLAQVFITVVMDFEGHPIAAHLATPACPGERLLANLAPPRGGQVRGVVHEVEDAAHVSPPGKGMSSGKVSRGCPVCCPVCVRFVRSVLVLLVRFVPFIFR